MKCTMSGLVWLVLALLWLPVVVSGESRTWTSASGVTVEAEFVERQGDLVVLRMEDGEQLQIRINQLSREDQVFVGAQRPGRAAAGPRVEAFGARLVNAQGRDVSPDGLHGKKIGLYFSAQWCPPCRTFTPELVRFHQELQQAGKPFEIIFVTSDRSEDGMYKYMRDYNMPWLALPFGDAKIAELKGQHGIRGIPALVIVDATGKALTGNVRGEVSAHGTAAFDRW